MLFLNRLALIITAIGISLSSCYDERELKFKNTAWLITMPPIEIDSTGATFLAQIRDSGSQMIDEYGFYWGKDDIDDPSQANRLATNDISGSKEFKARISHQLIKGVRYYIRAYIKIGQEIIVAPQVDFVSQGSRLFRLTSFEPKSGLPGQMIFIKGEGFSQNPEENFVTFNNVKSVPESAARERF